VPDSEGSYLKARISEALVESMFMRVGFEVSRSGQEAGPGEFLPDFMATKAIVRPDSDRPLHQLLPVAVKYCPDAAEFARLEGPQFSVWATQWPSLCLVVVTAHPDEGRSCFQVVDLAEGDGRTTQDLDKVPLLDIYATTVREYEHLVKSLFRLLDRRATTG
jgi:hypothetical protein